MIHQHIRTTFALLLLASAVWAKEPKIKPHFTPLPPGAVRPTGWLSDWARDAAAGITGHLDERADVFKHGYKGHHFEARGVKANGTGWPLEQCAYWLDGAVRLAYILDDPQLIAKVRARLDLVVDGVNRGGESFVYWQPRSILSVEMDKANGQFNNWAHSHMGRALVAYYQATGEKRILDALVKVYRDYPLPEFSARFMPVNGMVNLDPMLETYTMSGDAQVLSNALAAVRQPKFQEIVAQWNRGDLVHGHTVIFYENIRVPALMYPWTGDRKLLDATLATIRWSDERHGLPMGLVSGEEYLAGIGATRNVETCNVAAGPWTFGWLLRITGEREWADRMEKVFFNAGPVPIARDFQTMSYYQCANRLSMSLPNDRPGCPGNALGDSYRFTEIGHPVLCCVGNCNRIVPNYIMAMWMATADRGVAATLYGPNRLRTKVAGDVPVEIESETSYPFKETIRLTVRPARKTEFPLYLRIPAWCRKPSLEVNGRSVALTKDSKGFAKLHRSWANGDRVALRLPMRVEVVTGHETPFPQDKYFTKRTLSKLTEINNPFACVNYGPLLFALPIADENPDQPVKEAKFNYALDSSMAKVIRQAMPSRWSWQLDAPVKLQISARKFDWQPTELQPLPPAPVKDGEPATITLVPYGCTKFRVSMFPIVEDWQRRREQILANMELVMGPLPGPERRVPLDVQVVHTETLPKLTRKKITYAATKDYRVPAYLLIPHGLKGRAPAMLCLHGTSGPKGRTAGLGADYPRYTLELAERGYVTIAPDYTLLGENQVDPTTVGFESGTMMGIWSHMRAVDLLQSLPEVDPERIGCVGVSLGGHNSLFVGVFDQRLKVMVSSSGFDSFHNYKSGDLSGWCQPRYMMRIETVYGKDPKKMPFDFPDVLAALAPRHLYVHAPLGDSNFRVESAKRCVEAASSVYRLLGVADRIVAVYPPGKHGFPLEAREAAYRFIDGVLK
jgi:acetyl esterase/lipase